MAILGVGYIKAIDLGSNPLKINLTLSLVGIASGNPVTAQTVNLFDQDVNVLTTVFATNIKSALKTYLTTNFTYSFGLLDDVALIGSSLL